MAFDPMKVGEKSAELDAGEYLKQKLLSIRSNIKQQEVDTTVAGIDQLRALQRSRLQESQAGYQNYLSEKAEREKHAYATDEELGTFVGETKQGAAAAVQGGNRMVAEAAAFAPTVRGGSALAKVDDRARLIDELEDRTPEQEAYLDEVPQFLKDESVNPVHHKTRRQLLAQAREDLGTAKNIREFFNNTAAAKALNPVRRDALMEQLSDTYADNGQENFQKAQEAFESGDNAETFVESIKGVSKLAVAGVGDLIENPGATMEFILEQAPQLMVGGLGSKAAGVTASGVNKATLSTSHVGTALLGATNVAYGTRIFEEGLADYEEQNGRVASQAEAAEIAWWAGSASLFEVVGDASIVGSIRKISKVSPAVEGVVAKGLKRLTLDKTIQALKATDSKAINLGLKTASNIGKVGKPFEPVVRVASATAKSGTSESITETYQTAVEENLSKLNTDFNGEALFHAAAMGFAAGGGLAGGGSALKVVAGIPGEREKKKIKAAYLAHEKRNALFDNAVETGDLTPFTEPKNRESYNPRLAFNVLMRRQEREDLEPDVLEAEKEQAEKMLEDQQELKDSLIKEIEVLEAKEVASPKEMGQITQRAQEASDTLIAMKGARLAAAHRLNPEETVEDLVEAATTEETNPEAEQAAQATINLMMRDPTAVTAEQASVLAESTAFTPLQREWLRNFSEAHAAINALQEIQDVSQDVTLGRLGFKGINEYQVDVDAAIRSEDSARAKVEIEQLANFVSDHANKELAMAKAIETARERKDAGNRQSVFVVKDPGAGRGWRVRNEEPANYDRSLNGGYEVLVGDPTILAAERTLAAIKEENIALGKMAALLGQQVSMAFKEEVAADPRDVAPLPESEEELLGAEAVLAPSPESQEELTPESVEELVEPEPTPEPQEQPEAVAEPQAEEAVTEEEPQTLSTLEQHDRKAKLYSLSQRIDALQKQIDKLKPKSIEDMELKQAIAHLGGLAKEISKDVFDGVNQRAEGSIKWVFTANGKSLDGMAESLSEHGFFGSEPYSANLLQDMLSESLGEDGEVYSPQGNLSAERDALERDISLLEQEYAEQKTDLEQKTAPQPKTVEELVTEAVEEQQAEEPETEPEVTEAVVEEAPPVESGKLSVVGNKESRSFEPLTTAEFLKTNLISQYFKQSAADPDGVANPLVVVKDFMSSLIEVRGKDRVLSLASLKNFLAKEDQTLTQEQNTAVARFAEMWANWRPYIESNITGTKTNDDYRWKDAIHFLKEGETLPENVDTAIIVAIYTWISENAGGKGYNNEDTTRAIYGKTSTDPLTGPEKELVWDAGSRQNLIIQELGKKAAQALSLTADRGAPADSQQKLELSLGSHALSVMMQKGIVEQIVLTSPLLFKEGVVDGATSEAALEPQPFIRVRRNVETRVPRSQQVVDILESTQGLQEDGTSVGTGSIINKIFSVERAAIAPETSPGKFTQENTKGTREKVPSVMAKIARKVSKQKYRLREDMQRVRQALGRTMVERLAGFQENEYLQTNLEKSQNSSNEEIRRDIDRLEEFENGLQDTWFYFIPKIWSQQRAGLLANLVNPQTSKFQRHNIAKEAWRTTVDPLDPNSDNVKYFKLAVLQGLDYPVDKERLTAAMEAFTALLDNNIIMDAVQALSALDEMQEGDVFSDDQLGAIAEAVEEAGEKFHSLDALMNLAQYFKALEDGTSFETDIMYEVDGLTNGPALAHVLLGANLEKLGRLFGFYKEGDPRSSAEYRENGGKDLYETLASTVQEIMGRTSSYDDLKPIYHFTGDLYDKDGNVLGKGRTLVKQPLTSMVFGAGVDKAIETMGEDFVDSFYMKIQEEANKDGLGAVQNSVRGFNSMLRNTDQIEAPQTLEEAMAITLTWKQRKQAQEYFGRYVGEAVKEALEQDFADFMETRSELNKGAQALWGRYNAAFEYLKEEKRKELFGDDQLPHGIGTDPILNGKGEPVLDKRGKQRRKKNPDKKIPYQDLSQEHIDEIREVLKPLLPVVHTALSKASGDLEAGIDISKVDTTIARQGNIAYTAEVKLGAAIPTPQGRSPQQNKLTARGQVEVSVDPGVRAVIMLVHALDSAIASYSYNSIDSLNIHDALGLGVGQVLAGGQALNKNTFNLLAGYSLPLEISEALDRSFAGEAAVVEQHPGLAEVLNTVEVGKGKKVESVNNKLRIALRTTAVNAEYRKLEFLSQLEVVDQYAQEGANHEVTDHQRALVNRKKASLGLYAQDFVGPLPEFGTRTVSYSRLIPQSTPWGPIGRATVESDPILVQELEQEPKTTARKILKTLSEQIKATAPNPQISQFRSALLKQIRLTMNLDTEINYITPDSDSSSLNMNVDSARGWYSLDNKGETINVKSPDFANSGLTAELLLHEMTHAALAQTIHRLTNGKTTKEDKVALAGLAELEALRVEAEKYIATHNLTGFDEAVKDVDELVSWGMTNIKFQEGVLAQIEMKTKGPQNIAKSGMGNFVRGLLKILFGDKAHSKYQSGLGILIVNTGLLFESAQDNNPQQAEIHKQMAEDSPQSWSTAQIYQGLANRLGTEKVTDLFFDRHLQALLGSVVEKAYGPFGSLEASARRSAPATAEDVYLNALVRGEAPFASKLTAVINMTEQEAFVAESVEASMRVAMDASRFAQEEVRVLFDHAAEKIKPEDLYDGDWSALTETEQKSIEADWAVIFTVERNADGSIDYLSQFLAAALAYKPLYDAMGRLESPQDLRQYLPKGSDLWAQNTWAEIIKLVKDRLLNLISRFITGTSRDSTAQVSVERLAEVMVGIRQKRENKLQRDRDRPETWIEAQAKAGGENLRKKVAKIGESDFFQKSKSEGIQAIGNITSNVAGDRVGLLMDVIRRQRDGRSKTRLGLPGELINEMRGERDVNAWAHQLLIEANKNEQDRKRAMSDTAAFYKNSFGTAPSKKELEAITRTVLRTDLAALVRAGYSLDQIVELMADSTKLSETIAGVEEQLSPTNKDYYLAASRGLGHYMATGETRVRNLVFNARNIAFRAGTRGVIRTQGPEATAAAAAQPIIDTLVTLYALKASSDVHKNAVVEVARNEANRADGGNGFDLTMKLHQSMQDDALELLFENNGTHFMKGYTKDIFDPHTEIISGTAEEGIELRRAGYVKVTEDALEQDYADPSNEPRFLYVVADRGLTGTITGVYSNTGRKAKGTSLNSGANTPQGEVHRGNAKVIAQIEAAKQAGIEAMEKNGRNWDPAKEPNVNLLAPIFNTNGEVVNYRYLMEETTKDKLLKRDNRADKVFGNMAGSMLDKQVTPALNKLGVETLKAQYDDDYLRNPEAYLEFGPDSADKVMAERYRLLPEETKRDIRRVWGHDTMMVKKDTYNIMFGYRKYSLADMFDKKSREYKGLIHESDDYRNHFEQAFVSFFGTILGEKAALRILRVENIWQELVKEIKDIWVIKNFFTLMGNESSNLSILMLYGVPLKDIFQQKALAYKATLQYQAERRRLSDLQRMVDLKILGQKELQEAEQEMLKLEDSLHRNPVRELVDAGMFQTLVEDIAHEEDPYSYKSRMTRQVDRFTGAESNNKAVKIARGVGKTLLMTHDTAAYRFMNQATIMSDFTSRYVLHRHLTTRASNPLSQAESLQRARAAFVNYDVPTHKALQYLNDTGLLWFTKYYLRIQMVIVALVRENPARAAALMGLDYLWDFADILDSSMAQKWPGNLGIGALALPGAIDEIITLKVLTPL